MIDPWLIAGLIAAGIAILVVGAISIFFLSRIAARVVGRRWPRLAWVAALAPTLLLTGGIAIIVMVQIRGDQVTGSGPLLTRHYDLEDFTSVVVLGTSPFGFGPYSLTFGPYSLTKGVPLTVHITQSSDFRVSVTASKSLFRHIEVTTDQDTLRLGVDVETKLEGGILRANIRAPRLDKIELRGFVRGTVSEFRSSESLTISMTTPCNQPACGGSTLKGDVQAGNIDISLVGQGSTLTLEGAAKHVGLNIGIRNRVDLPNFETDSAAVTMRGITNPFGGGPPTMVTVNVKETLGPVVLIGKSSLNYMGEAAIRDTRIDPLAKLKKVYR